MNWKSKGVSEHVIWISTGVVVLIITGALLYFLLPAGKGGCDNLAALSAIEVKKAIECAANNGVDPETREKCSTKATVKLCQEDKASAYGLDFYSAYLGLAIPEYMIYYQEFPHPKVDGIKLGLKESANKRLFSDTYPFLRAYTGQRTGDLMPTVTEFKETLVGSYLKRGCTIDDALCVNSRGKEEIVKIDSEREDGSKLFGDVRIGPRAFLVEGGSIWSIIPGNILIPIGDMLVDSYPKFHLVSPCYAEVSFAKYSGVESIYDGAITNPIVASVNKLDANGMSNYCYADQSVLDNINLARRAENGCVGLDTALMFVSLGGSKAVEVGATKGASVVGKEVSKSFLDDVVKKTKGFFGTNFLKTSPRQLEKEGIEIGVRETFETVAVKEFGGKVVERHAVDSTAMSLTKYADDVGFELMPAAKQAGLDAAKLESKSILSGVGTETLGEGVRSSVREGAMAAVGHSDSYSRVSFKALGDQKEKLLSDSVFDALKKENRITGGMTDDALRAYSDDALEAMKRIDPNIEEKSIGTVLEQTIYRSAGDLYTTRTGLVLDSIELKVIAENGAGAMRVSAIRVVADNIVEVGMKAYVDKLIIETVKNSGGLTKNFWSKIAAHTAGRRFARSQGLPVTRGEALREALGILVPCLDVDYCRGAAACMEAGIWPTAPFLELLPEHMTGGKFLESAADVFAECCADYAYGSEKDPENIICSTPTDYVNLLTSEIRGSQEAATATIASDMRCNYNCRGVGGQDIPGGCVEKKNSDGNWIYQNSCVIEMNNNRCTVDDGVPACRSDWNENGYSDNYDKRQFNTGLTLSEVYRYFTDRQAKELGVVTDEFRAQCALVQGDLSKNCLDSIEVGRNNDYCTGLYETHTYDFGPDYLNKVKAEDERGLLVYVYAAVRDQVLSDGTETPCSDNVYVKTSTDSNCETAAYSTAHTLIVQPYPEPSSFTISGLSPFRCLKFEEEKTGSLACGLAYTSVVVNPRTEYFSAGVGKIYTLYAGQENNFVVPSGFSKKASEFCKGIRNCVSIRKVLEKQDQFMSLEMAPDMLIRADFLISGNDKIAIKINGNEESSVFFG